MGACRVRNGTQQATDMMMWLSTYCKTEMSQLFDKVSGGGVIRDRGRLESPGGLVGDRGGSWAWGRGPRRDAREKRSEARGRSSKVTKAIGPTLLLFLD